MKRLMKAVDIVNKHVTTRDQDNVWLLCGDEGKGKSNLLMHLVDYWNTLQKGVCTVEDIKGIAIDKEGFVKTLKEAKRFDIICDDEAADISNKRTMSNFNVLLSQAYQIIRGDNLFTILVIPSPFDLDAFFVKRRARGMIEVTARGRLRFYSKEKLRKIVELNANKPVKRVNRVKPSFVDTFPKYTGPLLEPYMTMKANKMKSVREDLYNKINGGSEISERDQIILDNFERGLTHEQIAAFIGISRQRVGQVVANANKKENSLSLGEEV